MKTDPDKRLFFAIEIAAAWPETLPEGRIIAAEYRHSTLAFLGNIPYSPLQNRLPELPLPSFVMGPTGRFDGTLLLPPQRANVVAWQVQWDAPEQIFAYQQRLANWLRQHGYDLDQRNYLPHVTLARQPFDLPTWKALNPALPLMGTALSLYESLGNLIYEPRWTHSFVAPFVTLSHTADIAFLIRGQDIQQVFQHAQLALSFECPALLSYHQPETPATLDALVQALNRLIARADAAIGVPLKAVSYHGKLFQDQNLLGWEMVVDV